MHHKQDTEEAGRISSTELTKDHSSYMKI